MGERERLAIQHDAKGNMGIYAREASISAISFETQPPTMWTYGSLISLRTLPDAHHLEAVAQPPEQATALSSGEALING